MKGLRLIGVKKTFERGTPNEKVALNGVDLEVAGGDFITVLGSNGAGKSTLFNAILGKFRLDRGQIVLDGEDITRQRDYQRALNIGCLYQDPLRGTAPNMTIEENLALAYTRKASRSFFAVNRRDSAYFQELLKALDLGLEEPKLLLLDEHTAALDPATAEKVLALTKEIVSKRGLTCLMITHNMQSALTMGNRTIVMDSGRIILDVSGQARESMTVPGLLELFRERSGRELDNDRMLLR